MEIYNLNLNTTRCTEFIRNKKGDLGNYYTPLQNLITEKGIGDFTTKNLNFNSNTPVDILITDEYDGSNNLIINDDSNFPKLINSYISVLENNTYNIPEHFGNSVTNVYEDSGFNEKTNLIKMYNNIPTLTFQGLRSGGGFSCGSYIFYFKLSDADGNLTNTVQESGVVQVHIGNINSKKIRMGMENENSDKCIKFLLSNIDSGFDYVRIFYERISTDNSQAAINSYFMIDLNFPIINKKCDITLTGHESVIQIDKSDIQNEFADIQTAKTQEIVHNILFLGNTSAYEQDYLALQRLAWRIIPSEIITENLGGIDTIEYDLKRDSNQSIGAYYDMSNVYNKVGYWPGEIYRFGVVFIYNNNLLSPVFNIQGCDFNKVNGVSNWYKKKYLSADDVSYEWYDSEPEDYIFNKSYFSNSKGVIKFSDNTTLNQIGTITKPKALGIKFDLSHLYDTKVESTNAIFKRLGIKGLFFVRQKRIPTILAQGLVIGLTGKDHGSIPVLYRNYKWTTMSFLDNQRLLAPLGNEIQITSKIETKALLVPDFELNQATFNQLFCGHEFYLEKIGNVSFKYNYNGSLYPIDFKENLNITSIAKLTAVPRDFKLITDGENYFSSIVGTADEPYKTSDVNKIWNKTAPQDLTVSTSLIRGQWGPYVGMSSGNFAFGDIVNIRPKEFENGDEHLLLEFKDRFKDYSLYSAISARVGINNLGGSMTCYRGDCFLSAFTHRMMNNFIDPELPTNTEIVDPACWAKNYCVRCTAELLSSTHSNLTGDSGGFYIPSPVKKKSAFVSLVFGILTGNIGTILNAIDQLDDEDRPILTEFANEICQAFEVYTGSSKNSDEDWVKKGIYKESDTLKTVVEAGHIKKVNPAELESGASGLSLKKIFKSDDKWELHGLASINRSDVNAVSFGQWITFPICSSYNLALRDIDFTNATEEALFEKKRSFFPYTDKNVKDHLPESNVINGAAKRSLSQNGQPAFTTIPYIKQEYFNRIYYSKPNITLNFINSYRFIFKDQYREYNKEFGAITKLVANGDNLLVVFLHGIGLLTVDRSIHNEQDATPYLSSKNVIPSEINILTSDYGSMWKDSVIKTPTGMIYGIDTVAKKIWRTQGSQLEFISDHKISKFLNDCINLSEFDFKEYQGHINVKTHYNEFKHDVIFTYYKDIPVDSNGNQVLPQDDNFDHWESGKTWSLCYNEITNQFITFYDWYPVHSCNIDNIFFSFNKEELNSVLANNSPSSILEPNDSNFDYYYENKNLIDKAFSNLAKVYYITKNGNSIFKFTIKKDTYFSLYYKSDSVPNISANDEDVIITPIDSINMENEWIFVIYKLENIQSNIILSVEFQQDGTIYVTEPKLYTITEDEDFNVSDKVLKYFNIRNSEFNKMYLWKHGQAGLYDNQGKIKPTHWYGKLHEFNVEFVVNQDALIQKVFNNLKIISNKTAPNKFEYEIVGEGYDWYELKPVILWINKHATNKSEFESYYKEVLTKSYDTLRNEHADFPELFGYEGKTIKKIPFLHLETCDKYGKQDKSYNQNTDYWDPLRPNSNIKKDRYSFNTSETILVEDDLLNEQRIHTESLGNDIKKYGRLRGNMQYLEDLWDIEIRPIKFNWAYVEKKLGLDEYDLKFVSSKEARHRDKYIKIKVRYSGEDLAVIQGIITMFDYSMA